MANADNRVVQAGRIEHESNLASADLKLPDELSRYGRQERALFTLAQRCFSESLAALGLVDAMKGFKFDDYIGDASDLKGTHAIDRLAVETIERVVRRSGLGPFNIYFEGQFIGTTGAKGTLFFDEIDGSRNLERKIGNPNFIFAFSQKTGDNVRLEDLDLAFVKSYTTNEEYYGVKGKGAGYFNPLTAELCALRAHGQTSIQQALVYLRPGYSLAMRQIAGTLPLFLRASESTRLLWRQLMVSD